MQIWMARKDKIIKRGITSRDFKITGRKNFYLYLSDNIIHLRLKDADVKKTEEGSYYKRYIEIKRGEIIQSPTLFLDTICKQQQGAIVVWDLPDSMNLSWETDGAKVISRNDRHMGVWRYGGRGGRRYIGTYLLCVIHNSGKVSVKYDDFSRSFPYLKDETKIVVKLSLVLDKTLKII